MGLSGFEPFLTMVGVTIFGIVFVLLGVRFVNWRLERRPFEPKGDPEGTEYVEKKTPSSGPNHDGI